MISEPARTRVYIYVRVLWGNAAVVALTDGAQRGVNNARGGREYSARGVILFIIYGVQAVVKRRMRELTRG